MTWIDGFVIVSVVKSISGLLGFLFFYKMRIAIQQVSKICPPYECVSLPRSLSIVSRTVLQLCGIDVFHSDSGYWKVGSGNYDAEYEYTSACSASRQSRRSSKHIFSIAISVDGSNPSETACQ